MRTQHIEGENHVLCLCQHELKAITLSGAWEAIGAPIWWAGEL
jgi:hypothetical protein